MDSLTPAPEVMTARADEVAATPALLPCPLEALPKEVHQYIHSLEERLRTVENSLRESSERMRGMGEFLFKNPATKMFLSALPKETQARLQEAFGGSNGNR